MTALVLVKTNFTVSKMLFVRIHYQRKISSYEQSSAVELNIAPSITPATDKGKISPQVSKNRTSQL